MDRGKHELFGRCVHIVNRIPLFIGEGIKFYLCVVGFFFFFFVLATNPYIFGKSDAASVFISCCWCRHNTGHRQWPVSGFLLFSPVFTVSVPHEQTVFPPELMESNLIAFHFLPAWLRFGANSKRYTFSILCLRAFICS